MKKLCIILAVLSGVSTAVAYRLYRHNAHLVMTYNALRLDPLGLNPPRGEVVNPDLILIGDSHCERWPRNDQAPRRQLNWGLGAQTSHQCLLRHRLEGSLLPTAPNVLISLGTNDLQCLGSFPDQADMILAGTLDNLRQLIRDVKGSRVILMTVPPRGADRLSDHSLDREAMDRARERLNAGLRTLTTPRTRLLDAAALLTPDHIGPDGIHLTPEGYRVLESALEGLLLPAP